MRKIFLAISILLAAAVANAQFAVSSVTPLPGHANDVRALGNTVYVPIVTGTTGVRIYNAQDPTNPIFVGSFANGTRAVSIDIVGNTLYVLDTITGELQVYDLSVDPNAPIFLGSAVIAQLQNSNTIKVVNDIAHVSGSGGLSRADVSNPATPSFIDKFPPGEFYFDVAVRAGNAYVTAALTGEVRIIDVSNPAPGTMSIIASAPAGNTPKAVAANNKNIYVSELDVGGAFRVRRFDPDLSNPTDIPGGVLVHDLELVKKEFLFVLNVTDATLEIYDIDKGAFTLIQSLVNPAFGLNGRVIAASKKRIYVATGTSGINGDLIIVTQ